MAQMHVGDFVVVSPAFEHGGPIPATHTGDGDGTSPALSGRTCRRGRRSWS